MATDARLGILLVAQGTQEVEQQFESVASSMENLNKAGGASISALNARLETLRAILARVQALQKQAEQTGSLTGVTTGLTRLNAIAEKTRAEISALDGTIVRFNRTTNASRLALIDIGRVLQDLPFGIIGVSNNINPLQESFSKLQRQAGGTGGAFKALLGSLKGAGGIGLILSAVTAAATFASVGLTFFSGRLNKVKKDAEDAKTPLDKLAESIAGTTAADLTKLTAVVGVIENVNTANNERARALKFVNDEYGPLLKNMGIEEVTLKNLKTAYSSLVEEMLKQAVVKGLQEQISKEVEKAAASLVKLELAQQKENDRLTDNAEKAKKAAQAQKELADGTAKIKFDPKPLQDGAIAQAALNREQTATIKQQDNIQFQIDKIKAKLLESLAPALKLATSLTDLSLDVKTDKINASLTEEQRKIIQLAKEAEKAFKVPLELKFDDTDLAKEQLRKAQDVLRGIKDFTIKARIDIPLPDIKPLPKEQVDKFFDHVPNAVVDAVNKGLIDASKAGTFIVPINPELDPDNAFNKEIEAALKKLDSFHDKKIRLKVEIQGLTDKGAGFLDDINKAIEQAILNTGTFSQRLEAAVKLDKITQQTAGLATTINGLLTPAFQGLFDAILQGANPLQAFFKGLIKAVEQLIGKLIAAAVEAAILASLNIVSGGFTSIFGKLLGFKEGGRYPVGEDIVVGEAGPEIVRFDKPGSIVPNKDVPRYLRERSSEHNRVTNTEAKAYFEYLTFQTTLDKTATRSLERIERTFAINDNSQRSIQSLLTSNSEEIKEILSKSSTLTGYDHLKIFEHLQKERSTEKSRTDSDSSNIKEFSNNLHSLFSIDKLRMLDHLRDRHFITNSQSTSQSLEIKDLRELSDKFHTLSSTDQLRVIDRLRNELATNSSHIESDSKIKEVRELLNNFRSLTTVDQSRVLDRLKILDRNQKETSVEKLRTDRIQTYSSSLEKYYNGLESFKSDELKELTNRFNTLSSVDQLRIIDHLQKEKLNDRQKVVEKLLISPVKQDSDSDSVVDRLQSVKEIFSNSVKTNITVKVFERIEREGIKGTSMRDPEHSTNLASPIVKVLASILSTKENAKLQTFSHLVTESKLQRSRDWSKSFMTDKTSDRLVLSNVQKNNLIEKLGKEVLSATRERNILHVKMMERRDNATHSLLVVKDAILKEINTSKVNQSERITSLRREGLVMSSLKEISTPSVQMRAVRERTYQNLSFSPYTQLNESQGGSVITNSSKTSISPLNKISKSEPGSMTFQHTFEPMQLNVENLLLGLLRAAKTVKRTTGKNPFDI